MKILTISDLHIEFHLDGGKSIVNDICGAIADVLVIAGDIAPCTNKFFDSSLRKFCDEFKDVVIVGGNHEFYGTDVMCYRDTKTFLCKEIANLRWLDNSCTTINGVRFVGTTLWFPKCYYDWDPEEKTKRMMNDFNCIRGFEPWVYDEHQKALEFLERELHCGDVLVTHHMPFARSISPMYARSVLNPFFYAGANAESIVMSKKPKLAIHGHTHSSMDYEQDGVRVVCNPHGYPQENKSFDFLKTIEL